MDEDRVAIQTESLLAVMILMNAAENASRLASLCALLVPMNGLCPNCCVTETD